MVSFKWRLKVWQEEACEIKFPVSKERLVIPSSSTSTPPSPLQSSSMVTLACPPNTKPRYNGLRNCHLPHLLFEDHLSRVSGPSKLLFSNLLFHPLILSIVHPEPSGQSHLSKPYNHPSPAPSPSSSYSTFLQPIMPRHILAWERALVSSKLPSFSVKQKQEMKIVSKTIFPPPDLLLKGDSTNSTSAFNNWILSRQDIQWLQSRLPFPPTPLSSGRSSSILVLQKAAWDRLKVKKGILSRGW